MNQPRPQDLIQWLREPLTAALGKLCGPIQITLLSKATRVLDGTTVLLIRDASGTPCAVALCSSPAAPDMISRAMNRAHAAKTMLGASSMGAAILDPLLAGDTNGLSYAVLPYCEDLSNLRLVWWFQRALIRQPVLEWLWQVNRYSIGAVEPGAMDARFAEPLHRIASLEQLGGDLREAARRAIGRLDSGAWIPRHVLMHGDLWRGNVLVQPRRRNPDGRRWSDRFVVIDWAGSELQGYAFYDLARLAESMRLPDAGLRREVVRHCEVLGCEISDAKSYLLAALGHIHMNLEHFPLEAFLSTAGSSFSTLGRALAR